MYLALVQANIFPACIYIWPRGKHYFAIGKNQRRRAHREEEEQRILHTSRRLHTPVAYIYSVATFSCRESFTPCPPRGAHKHVSPYLDACFRTNTKSIMRAVRALSLLVSFSFALAASDSPLSHRARGEQWGARSYSPLQHPWQHNCDGPRARSDQCHRRAPLSFASSLCSPVVMTTASLSAPPGPSWRTRWGLRWPRKG